MKGTKKLQQLEKDYDLIKYYYDLMNSISFKSQVAIILDLLEYQNEIFKKLQGNNNSIIEYYDCYYDFVFFLNKIYSYDMEDVVPKLQHFLDVSIEHPDKKFDEAFDLLRDYVIIMIDDINNGHLGNENRLKEMVYYEYIYKIAKCPFSCDTIYYEMIPLNDPAINLKDLLEIKPFIP